MQGKLVHPCQLHLEPALEEASTPGPSPGEHGTRQRCSLGQQPGSDGWERREGKGKKNPAWMRMALPCLSEPVKAVARGSIFCYNFYYTALCHFFAGNL